MSQKKYRRLRALEKQKVETKSPHVAMIVTDSFWSIIKKNWIFLLCLCIGVVLLYVNGMNGAFVSDDYASITQETNVLNPSVMMNGFNTMRMSTYFLALMFGVKSPVPFHVFGLLLYLLFIIISFSFVAKIFGKNIAYVYALLFGTHPIHVEAVTWISGRIYVILGLYILLGLMAFVNYLDTGKFKYGVWTGIFFILGFLTDKPRPFSLVFLILLYMWYVGWKSVKNRISKFMPYVWVACVMFLIFAIPYIKNRINIVNSGYNFSESIFYNPFFQYPTGIAKYLQLLWVPIDLTLYHTLYIFEPWFNWLILLTFVGLIGYSFFKEKRIFFALMFMLLALAPSIAPIKVSWLVAERYIFLGSLGWCVFLAFLYEMIDKKIKIVAPTLLIMFLVFFSVRTFLRNIDWQTNHNLWVRTVQYSWNSHNAWNNIGDDYDKLNQMDNAIKGFGQSYVVKPNYADAYHNQANIFFKIKRYDLARAGYEKALYYSPGLYQSYISLTQVALYQGDINGAFGYATKLVEAQPNNPQAYYVLGVVYAQGGDLEAAKKSMGKAVQLSPGYEPAVAFLKQVDKKP